MILTLFDGLYPDFVGRRQLFAGTGTGPTVYNSTTGDIVTLNNTRLYIDVLFGGIQSVGGVYTVFARPSAVGIRQSWTLHWFTTVGMTEVANGSAALAGVEIQLGGFCGQF